MFTSSIGTLNVGSIILAPGFKSFDPGQADNYGYCNQPDVVTSLEFERILSATGPYGGHLLRPSSKQTKKQTEKQPKKIAWLQCVGSRETNRCGNGYCSSVCCMYAVKQTIMAKEHAGKLGSPVSQQPKKRLQGTKRTSLHYFSIVSTDKQNT